jgi:hypothetical protein
MTQQINLLRPKDRSAGAAAAALGAVGVVVVVLAGYFVSVLGETNRLRDAATLKNQQLTQVKRTIQTLQAEKAKQSDASALEAEIAALRPGAEALAKLVQLIRGGNPGAQEGFARYLQTLGSLSAEGLWISNLSVSQGGNAVVITGRALQNEAVMQYARRLNEAFGPQGVRFKTLELTPEGLAAPGAPATAPPVLTTVAFKLS